MISASQNRPLVGRTVLISPSVTGDLATEFERHGARVLTWPRLELGQVESHAALDEAIENLFGYDWLIFRNIHAVDFFLRRFRELGRDMSDLDALSICAIGEATHARLEEFPLHVDVVPDQLSSAAAFSAIESYVGGRDSLAGMNFLIPRAAIASDSLTRSLEELGARGDEVTTYRTCSIDNTNLAQIKGLLTGGGIDCVVFATSSEVRDFAAVFDTNDIQRLVDGIAVACIDENTAKTAGDFGARTDISSGESTLRALASAVSEHFTLSA
jgi:uroporphyrinogen III methyltransferase/synthase